MEKNLNLKKIQEFFSKPLEEGKQLDKSDFDQVVKAVEQTGHPVTVLLVPKFNEIEVLTGMDAPDDMIRDLSNAVGSLGYGRNDIIIAADSSNLSRREYSDIFRVKGGHQDYFEESVNERIDALNKFDKFELDSDLNETKYRVEYTTQDGEKAKSRMYNSEEEADKKEKKLVDSGVRKAKVVKAAESIDEASLGSTKSQSLANAINSAMLQIDDSMSYTDFADAVANILIDEYGTHNFTPFMEVLHARLGMNESMLSEAKNTLLKQAKLSSAEYQKAKKLKDFNKDDYKWNPGESLYIKLNETDDREDDELSPEELANKYAGSPFFKENLAQTLAETIKLGEGVIEEELCPKGKAYIKRRKAAGEKSSAYLSGRAVKVCKGQMSGRKKRK